MKLRIKGNSVRLRLTKTEVEKLALAGFLEEHTSFGNNIFSYSLQSSQDYSELSADFQHCSMTVYIPAAFVMEWVTNDTVGIETQMHTDENGILYLLVEKDFKCIDETTEDQSDNFENPQTTCHE